MNNIIYLMRKSDKIIVFSAAVILLFSCVTENNGIEKQEKQFGKYVTLRPDRFKIDIPADMFIMTKSYYTKGAEKCYNVTDGDTKRRSLSINEIKENFVVANRLLHATSDYADMEIYSFLDDDKYFFAQEMPDAAYLSETIKLIVKKMEEKVIHLGKPSGRLKIENIGIIEINGNSFLKFSKVYGGHIIDEEFYCVKNGGNIIVISVIIYGEQNDFIKNMLESLCFDVT